MSQTTALPSALTPMARELLSSKSLTPEPAATTVAPELSTIAPVALSTSKPLAPTAIFTTPVLAAAGTVAPSQPTTDPSYFRASEPPM